MNWHWLKATGHVLFVIWPYAATVVASTLFSFSLSIVKQLEGTEERLNRVEERLAAEQQVLAGYRNGWEIRRAWENANEWQQRYALQLQHCEVEHVVRPLPIMPLDAQQAQELNEELPF